MFSQVPDFQAWFPDLDGFPRPDWKATRDWIRQNVASDRLNDAWQAITREWLDRARERLGKSYVVTESIHFHLLSEDSVLKSRGTALGSGQIPRLNCGNGFARLEN